jgi:hypothetical protein
MKAKARQMFQAVIILPCFRDVPNSNVARDSKYPAEFPCGFLQTQQANTSNYASASFLTLYYLLTTPSFNAVWSLNIPLATTVIIM